MGPALGRQHRGRAGGGLRGRRFQEPLRGLGCGRGCGSWHGAFLGDAGRIEDEMAGEDRQVHDRAAQEKGRGAGGQQARAPERCGNQARDQKGCGEKGQGLHGRPPERHAEGGVDPRMPSWEALGGDDGQATDRADAYPAARWPGCSPCARPAPCAARLRRHDTRDAARSERVPCVISPSPDVTKRLGTGCWR